MRGFREGGLVPVRWLAGGVLLAFCGGLGGCGGGGDGGPGPDPVLCSITNVSTGAQTSWLVGVDGPANLRWDRTGSAANVKIELLKAGVVVAVAAPSTANDGFYAWTPTTGGQANGSDFGLRVTALGETGCAGEKTGLTLTDVTGCTLAWTTADLDTINAGPSLQLTWTSGSTSGLLDIELWQDDLGSEPELVGVVAVDTPDDGLFVWDPVDSFNYGTNDWFELRLADPRVAGCEAMTLPFRMVDDILCSTTVLGFSAGSSHDEGTTMNLSFAQQHGSGLVDLYLMVGHQPVPGGMIANDVPVSQIYNWTVNDYGSVEADRDHFRIRATDSTDGYCVDVSDIFTIPQ